MSITATLIATHAYIGRRPCGHVMYMGVDDGGSDLAKDIAEVVRSGNTVERVTIEEARQMQLYCRCDQPAGYDAQQRAAAKRAKDRIRRGGRR